VPVERWTSEQVLALAPDASSQKSARGLATPTSWSEWGVADGEPPTVWGLCKGSGKSPYQTCVDLAEPAYRCSCPSRKFPCKHALALLLNWAAGAVPEAPLPGWVGEWHESRAGRKAAAETRRAAAPSDPAASARRAAQRATRVGAGLDELDRWLADQVRGGFAGLDRAGYGHWETMAARLVDAQAPTVAGTVRQLATVTVGRPTWAEDLLGELALLRLLCAAYRRVDDLDPALAATVRARVGFPVPADDVLATEPVRDVWQVVGVRDEQEDRLTARRVWLRGRDTGRPALVLSFAAPGQALPADLVLGTGVDADLCFFPGALPIRALVRARHGEPVRVTAPAGGCGVAAMLDGYATALAAEPWLREWPVLLDDVVPVRGGTGWFLVDAATGDGVPVRGAEPWRLVAAAAGAPVTVAGEWRADGLLPSTAWKDGGLVWL